MRLHSIVFLTATALSAADVAHAQVNKCVDANGRVVGYGSACPAGTRAETTGIRNVPQPSAAESGKSIAEQETEFRKRQIERRDAQAKADKIAADDRIRASNCENARSYLKSLQSGVRITRSDPNTGERTVLGEAEHASETAKAQRAIEANCK